MRFNDNSFNTIICGWTINYSDNPALAAKEMIRVMRKNAIIAEQRIQWYSKKGAYLVLVVAMENVGELKHSKKITYNI